MVDIYLRAETGAWGNLDEDQFGGRLPCVRRILAPAKWYEGTSHVVEPGTGMVELTGWERHVGKPLLPRGIHSDLIGWDLARWDYALVLAWRDRVLPSSFYAAMAHARQMTSPLVFTRPPSLEDAQLLAATGEEQGLWRRVAVDAPPRG